MDPISDQRIALTGPKSKADYPDAIRRIRFCDRENDRYLTFLTNNFLLPTLTIAKLYKLRWHVKLFFRWIKKNLRIKSFYGTSENAARTQTWVAITIYVLVMIIKKRLDMQVPLYALLQILSIMAFKKTPLNQLLTETNDHESMADDHKQLLMFNL